MKTLVSRLLFFLLLTVFIGGAFAQKTEVVFWQFSTRDSYIDAWNRTIEQFEAQNPDIDVVMEVVPWAEQQQRLVSALTTGGLPDVSFLGNNVVAQFQSIGALAPLDDYFAQYSQEYNYDVTDDVWSGDRGYYYLNGQWWASPLAVETRVLYYRKDLFEQAGLDPDSPPQTWDELIDTATRLQGSLPESVYPIALPMSIDYGTIQNFMSWYLSYGGRLLNDEGQCGLNTPEFKEALSKYTSIYTQGLTHPDATTLPGGDLSRGFRDGNFAMIFASPDMWQDLRVENAPFAEQVAVAPVPAGPEGRFGFLGGWPLVLWNQSNVKDAAAKWILFATRPEGGLKDLSVNSGMIPGSQKLAQESPWDASPFTVFVSQLQNAAPYQYPDEAIPEMGQLEVDTVQNAVQAVALGQQDVDQATQNLCTTMNQALNR